MNNTAMNIPAAKITGTPQHPPLQCSSLLVPKPRLLTDAQTNILITLEAMPKPERQRCAVHSLNPCPEYLDDLWNLEPCVLLSGPQTQQALDWALELASSSKRHRETDGLGSSLIPSERALLRYLPGGLSNKHIAKHLGISDRTVRNRLVDIGEKLGLTNRTQIAMYYAGQWQWLERYRQRFARWNLGTAMPNAAD
jgi:DNA-binding CsgD family transcriptional regulator